MNQALIVGAAGDSLTRSLPAALANRGWSARTVAPERLSDLSLTLDGERLTVAGEPVSAIVFRAATNAPFSASFADDDRAFCDAETRAIWLGALNLPGLASFNRLDAIAWFETEHWAVWRRVLARAGVPLERCELGYARDEVSRVWVPFSACSPEVDPGETIARAGGIARLREQRFACTLVACGRVIDGPASGAIDAAIVALAKAGVQLAEIVSDERGEIAWVDTAPRELPEPASARVVEALADAIAEHGR